MYGVEATGYETVTQYTPSGAGSYKIDFALNPVITGTPTPIATPTTTRACPCQLGDVNCDGQINIVDALMVAQYTVGLYPGNFLVCAADVSNPCIYTPCIFEVNIIDALIIAQYVVGLINSL